MSYQSERHRRKVMREMRLAGYDLPGTPYQRKNRKFQYHNKKAGVSTTKVRTSKKTVTGKRLAYQKHFMVFTSDAQRKAVFASINAKRMKALDEKIAKWKGMTFYNTRDGTMGNHYELMRDSTKASFESRGEKIPPENSDEFKQEMEVVAEMSQIRLALGQKTIDDAVATRVMKKHPEMDGEVTILDKKGNVIDHMMMHEMPGKYKQGSVEGMVVKMPDLDEKKQALFGKYMMEEENNFDNELRKDIQKSMAEGKKYRFPADSGMISNADLLPGEKKSKKPSISNAQSAYDEFMREFNKGRQRYRDEHEINDTDLPGGSKLPFIKRQSKKERDAEKQLNREVEREFKLKQQQDKARAREIRRQQRGAKQPPYQPPVPYSPPAEPEKPVLSQEAKDAIRKAKEDLKKKKGPKWHDTRKKSYRRIHAKRTKKVSSSIWGDLIEKQPVKKRPRKKKPFKSTPTKIYEMTKEQAAELKSYNPRTKRGKRKAAKKGKDIWDTLESTVGRAGTRLEKTWKERSKKRAEYKKTQEYKDRQAKRKEELAATRKDLKERTKRFETDVRHGAHELKERSTAEAYDTHGKPMKKKPKSAWDPAYRKPEPESESTDED